MNKSELVARLAAATGLSKANARRALDALFDPDSGLFARLLYSDQSVSVASFGTFTLEIPVERTSRPPKPGGAIRVASSASVRFRPSGPLRDVARSTSRKTTSKASSGTSKSTRLVAPLAVAAGLSRENARRVVDALFDVESGIIVKALSSGETVSIMPFGRFSLRDRPERQGRNPQTGAPIRIPRSMSVRFRASSKLNDAAQTATRAVSEEPREPAPPESFAPGSGEPDELLLGGEAQNDVRFTAYHPKEVRPLKWYTVLAYAHLPGAVGEVRSDSRARLGQAAADYGKGKGEATTVIKRGAEITVVPELPGCRFNPKRASFTWLKDWHRAEFEMQATPEQQDYSMDQAVNGRIAFYVGPVLVGEVKIWGYISDTADETESSAPRESASSEAYRRIFVSYAHRDAKIVEALERAYKALGDTYLRDVNTLRAGEAWNEALLRMIEHADIFQLCWSSAAMRSKYVRQEYLHALQQRRGESFIRPTFWETPMPTPPSELQSLHFAYQELE